MLLGLFNQYDIITITTIYYFIYLREKHVHVRAYNFTVFLIYLMPCKCKYHVVVCTYNIIYILCRILQICAICMSIHKSGCVLNNA